MAREEMLQVAREVLEPGRVVRCHKGQDGAVIHASRQPTPTAVYQRRDVGVSRVGDWRRRPGDAEAEQVCT